ncbi:MAG: chemotaxis-specific protein-glutamate methyltransferase CheB [Candidatus Xenobia bacterium]
MRALILEDSRSMRAILSDRVQAAGFEPLLAADAREAMALLEREPQLALVESALLEREGLPFIVQTRAQHRFDRLRILMVTGESDMAQMARAMEAGADGVLRKPFTPEGLTEMLRAVGLGVAAADGERVRVLVVDDSAVVRRTLTHVLAEEPRLDVVANAANGEIALQYIDELQPDVVTLDVEMPVKDGLATLLDIRRKDPTLPVIMVSSLTEKGAAATIDALSYGATDYITKPSGLGSAQQAREKLREELIPKLLALSRRHRPTQPVPTPAQPLLARTLQRVNAVAIGISTGGPEALATVLPALPRDFPVPLFIVQHMPPMFTALLAERLSSRGALPVLEAKDGDRPVPGKAYLAPGDYHMRLVRNGDEVVIRLDQGPKENSCRPAVDVLFRSVADVYGARVLAVIMTGMGQDGLEGCRALRQRGAQILAQDEATSVVWGMPGFVARAGLADTLLPLSEVANEIASRAGMGRMLGEPR